MPCPVAGLSDHPTRDLDIWYCFVFIQNCFVTFSLVEIGFFPPPVNVSISSSVAAHARSRIINIVSDMTSRQRMKAAVASSLAIEPAVPSVSVGDIQNIMAKWKFRCYSCKICYCDTDHDAVFRCTSAPLVNSDSNSSLLKHVLAFISAHVDDGLVALRERLSSSAASALVVLKVDFV